MVHSVEELGYSEKIGHQPTSFHLGILFAYAVVRFATEVSGINNKCIRAFSFWLCQLACLKRPIQIYCWLAATVYTAAVKEYNLEHAVVNLLQLGYDLGALEIAIREADLTCSSMSKEVEKETEIFPV